MTAKRESLLTGKKTCSFLQSQTWMVGQYMWQCSCLMPHTNGLYNFCGSSAIMEDRSFQNFFTLHFSGHA